MADDIEARLTELRRKLAARTDRRGNPLPAYRDNVPALQAEIARLESPTDG